MPIRVHPGNLEKVKTHCNLCAMQCGFKLWVEPENNQVIGLEGDVEFPTTHGLMCVKGSHSYKQINHPDRIKQPLLRNNRDESFRVASWEEALDFCAARIKAVQSEHGNAAMGVYGGGALTNETVYLLGKWARLALKTPNIDYNGRFCMSSAAAAQNKAFGVDRGLPFPVSDIERAQFILLIGANIAECLPPLVDIFKEAKAKGTIVFVVDPRKTDSLRITDRHLSIRPGTDLAFALGLLHVIIRENWVDRDFIVGHTKNFEAMGESVKSCTPEWAAALTGLSLQDIELTARLFSKSSNAMILSARGAEQQSKGVDTVLAFINIVLATGKIGRPGCGFGTLTGQGNGQGGREHGQKADQLPGYRKIDNPIHRQEIAQVWEVDEKEIPGPGLSAYELLDAMAQEKIKGMFVMGSNPVVSAPKVGPLIEGFKKLKFLAVADFFVSETAQMADVIFPVTVWAEESGTMTNLEGRVILREQALQPLGESRPDWKILCGLAEKLGLIKGFRFNTIEDVFEELRRATKGGIADYAGISYEKLRVERGVHWPCPSDDHPGTPRLFEDKKFWHADGRAVFHPVSYRPIAEEPDADYPHLLTTGRVLEQYLSGNQTHRIPELNDRAPEPVAEMNPEIAGKLSLQEGQTAVIKSRRGQIKIKIHISEKIRPDTIFVPFHWGGDRCINLLTNPALDPVSRMPEFKVCAVRIEKGVA